MQNQLKTILLLGALSAVLVAIGGSIGGTALHLFLGIAIAINVLSYFFSDRLVLRMSGARLVDEQQAPALHALVRDLADRARLPMPRLAVVADPTPNAFATGRSPDRAVIAVTEGLLHLVDARQLRGVLAHELAHVRNRDTLIATIAAAAATAVSYIANAVQWAAIFGGGQQNQDGEGQGQGSGAGGGLLTAMLAPIAATMLQMGISRSREYLADEWAARLTEDPEGLAQALLRLQQTGEAMLARGAEAPAPATASLAIVNPLVGQGFFRLFATHPPIADRVARLRAMAATWDRRTA